MAAASAASDSGSGDDTAKDPSQHEVKRGHLFLETGCWPFKRWHRFLAVLSADATLSLYKKDEDEAPKKKEKKKPYLQLELYGCACIFVTFPKISMEVINARGHALEIVIPTADDLILHHGSKQCLEEWRICVEKMSVALTRMQSRTRRDTAIKKAEEQYNLLNQMRERKRQSAIKAQKMLTDASQSSAGNRTSRN